jgi:hypothetical protein
MAKKPTHLVYSVKQTGSGEGKKNPGIWTKIGAAFMHKDGKGLDITLDLIPFDRRLVLREPKGTTDAPDIPR